MPLAKARLVCMASVTLPMENDEILEGDVLAHSPHREEIMALLGQGLAQDVTVEWCGALDDERVVII